MHDYIKIYAKHFGITWDRSKFEVHHIDGDRGNNDINNLLLLPKDLHRALHQCNVFDAERYEMQMLQLGMSDQDPDDLPPRVQVLEKCRVWAMLRVVGYRYHDGTPMVEITEDTAV
ncbi:MAG: HNH endonuclease [Oscillibacter sp.]|nr:HNH endonuclease [Oscillibacter sp.]MBR1690629.1 HNH endonuclease [Oscillibacter sp.]